MFSREFLIGDTIRVWDALFSSIKTRAVNVNESLTGPADPNLCLVDFFCIGMMRYVRDYCKIYVVMSSDVTEIFDRMTHYPPVEDIQVLINMAYQYQQTVFTSHSIRFQRTIDSPLTPRRSNGLAPILEKIKTSFSFIRPTTPNDRSAKNRSAITWINTPRSPPDPVKLLQVVDAALESLEDMMLK